MQKVDIRKTFDWKIDAECRESKYEIGSPGSPEFTEYLVETNPICFRALERDRSPKPVNINGIGDYQSGCRKTVFEHVLKTIRDYSQHLFLQKVQDLDDNCVEQLLKHDYSDNILIINDITGHKSVKNVRELRKKGYKSVLEVSVTKIDGAFEFLPNTDWVVISETNNIDNLSGLDIIAFLKECNGNQIPFWFSDQIDLDALVLKAVKEGTRVPVSITRSGAFAIDFLDLPNHVLYDSNMNLDQDVQEIHNRILTSKENIIKSTMELAYRLYQLDALAKTKGKRAFWQINFGVNTFTEYCENKLEISSNLGSQYLKAIRVANRLQPNLLEEAFSSKTPESDILTVGHTRFRDITRYVVGLERLRQEDPDRFNSVMKYTLDSSNSNRNVITNIRHELGMKEPEKVLIDDANKQQEKLIKRISSFGRTLRPDISAANREGLDKLIKEIVELLHKDQSEIKESVTSEVSEAEWSDIPPWQKTEENISRETFSDEVEVDAPDSILPDTDDADDKPTNHYVEGQIKDGKWKKVTLQPEITGLERPMEILTAPRGSSFIKCAWHGDKDTFCPPIWADIALGSGACGFGCRTCFLMLTFRSMRDPNRPLVYTNYERIDSDVKKWLMAKHYYYEDKDKKKIRKKRSYKETIGLGIDCADSLLFEGYTQNLRRIAPIFQSEKSNPLNTQLVLLTKSANTHFLKTVKPKNIIVTMSLNPEGIADLWEGKYQDGVRITPPITYRLEALRYAQDLGFETRIRLDPILTPDNWEDQYRDFVNEMYGMGIKPSFITLGTYREKNHQIDTWREKWGLLPAEVDDFNVGDKAEGTHFHIQGRNQIYSSVEAIIKKGYAGGSFRPHVSLCKETFNIRKELGMTNMYCNCLKSESV